MSPSPKKSRSRRTPKATSPKAVETPVLPWNERAAWIWFRDGLGWGLVIFVLIAVLAMVSRTYGGGEANWMGPYLGEALAVNLGLLLGRLPRILFLLALVLSALTLLLPSRRERFLFPMMGSWLLLFWLMLLFTLRIANVDALSRVHLESNGGMIGVFLYRNLMQPIFGASLVGPAIFCVLGILFTLIWGFRLRWHHVAWLQVVWHKIRHQVKHEPVPIQTSLAQHYPQAQTRRIEPETDEFATIRRGQVKPFQAEGLTQPLPESVEKVADSEPETQTSTATSFSTATAQEFQSYDAIAQLEAMLANARHMDPRQVRRLRDELADLRRIKDMNEWEDRRKEEVRIEGIVKRTRSNAVSSEEDPTLLSEQPTIQMHERPTVSSNSQQETEVVYAPGATAQWHQVSEARQEEDESLLPPQPLATEETLAKPRDFVETVYDDYAVPEVGQVLPEVPEQDVDFSADELQEYSVLLEQQLGNFRIRGKVVGISTGPVITRFEVEPGPGVKVSRFQGLADDLALALKATSVRILAPIPGKAVVGIEIPNRKAQIVYCREILESPRFQPNGRSLMIALGKDITGNAFVMDLARAPHLLIAGQTGSGKSVCINTLMASLLFSKTPDDLRMILVDPKVVELKSYEKIPHLLHPVVTDPATAVQALQWACWEMDRRYELLAQAKVRNIAGFNEKINSGDLQDELDAEDCKKMPYIVIIVDEFADVIMQAKKEFEDPVIRLAQKARAAGLHLVLATQRPSANVITGVIKANLPTRISFKVASHIDARTVMDKAGAEKLLGRGDMLFRAIDDPDPVRVHGAFLTDSDAEQMALACADQHVDYPQLTSFMVEEGNTGSQDPLDEVDDPLFWDAAELVVSTGSGSTSMLQRRMRVGYARAGRLMDLLFRAGIVGPERGSKPREALFSEEEIQNLRRSRGV